MLEGTEVSCTPQEKRSFQLEYSKQHLIEHRSLRIWLIVSRRIDCTVYLASDSR